MQKTNIHRIVIFFLIIVLSVICFANKVFAALKNIAMKPGDRTVITCDGKMNASLVNTKRAFLSIECGPATNTPSVPTPTVHDHTSHIPPQTISPTGDQHTTTPSQHAQYSDMSWHPPGSHGDRPPHEHGDPPPEWVIAAGYTPMYDHHGNTPNENVAYWKHTGFKGWAGNFNGVDWYGIFHLDFNPSGHPSRFHSYQLWLKDGTGAVSHMNGWLDFGSGNNTGPNLVRKCTDSSIRPIMSVNTPGCPVEFESWYSRGPIWGPDIGFNINANYYAGGDPANPSTWTPINGSVNNTERRIEWSWYSDRSAQRGEFWATQFGDIVNGSHDPICGTQKAYGEKSYTVLCLKQYIAPSLTSVVFPGNAVQTKFPGTGIALPN